MLTSGKGWLCCSKTSGDSKAPLSKLALFKSKMKVLCFLSWHCMSGASILRDCYAVWNYSFTWFFVFLTLRSWSLQSIDLTELWGSERV